MSEIALDHDYCDYFDYKNDFYSHMEKCLEDNNQNFDPEILNFDKKSVEPNDLRKVSKLLRLLNSNEFSLDSELLIKMLRALFCWQCQFDDLDILINLNDFVSSNRLFLREKGF
jgi:hypothetical protein